MFRCAVLCCAEQSCGACGTCDAFGACSLCRKETILCCAPLMTSAGKQSKVWMVNYTSLCSFTAPSTPELTTTKNASQESLEHTTYRRHASFQSLGMVSHTRDIGMILLELSTLCWNSGSLFSVQTSWFDHDFRVLVIIWNRPNKLFSTWSDRGEWVRWVLEKFAKTPILKSTYHKLPCLDSPECSHRNTEEVPLVWDQYLFR